MTLFSAFGVATPDLDFFLEHVEHIDRLRKRDRVGRAVRVTVVVLHQLHDLARETFAERPCADRPIPVLCVEKRAAEDTLDVLGHSAQILATTPHEVERFSFRLGHWPSIARLLLAGKTHATWRRKRLAV
jgi:hypothetical protein